MLGREEDGSMVDRTTFLAQLARWDLPLGPLREPEDIWREMRATASSLGPDAAPALAELLEQLERAADPRREVLSELLQLYAEQQGEALAQALLARLHPDGPPLLVELLGSTGSPRVAPALAATLDVERAGDDLLVALACTLGELALLGDEPAIALLRAMDAVPTLSGRVREELDIALANLQGAS